LERLLRLRILEEDRQRFQLETAVAERQQIDAQLAECARRRAVARALYARAVDCGDRLARMDSELQVDRADRDRPLLEARRVDIDGEVERQRTALRQMETRRRQVEALVEEEARRARAEAAHRAQQMLDDWFGRRREGMRTRTGSVKG
jgi:flagellar export protein FliJ